MNPKQYEFLARDRVAEMGRNTDGDQRMARVAADAPETTSAQGQRGWMGHLVAVCEALREVVAGRETGTIPADAIATLNAASREATLAVVMGSKGKPALRPTGGGIDVFLARLFADIAAADRTGTWRQLKVCRRDACRWAFFDTSRNHPVVWCSMSLSGNRSKSARLRRRRRATGTTDHSPTRRALRSS